MREPSYQLWREIPGKERGIFPHSLGKRGRSPSYFLYFLILAQRVLRSMPKRSAARVLFPNCARGQ